jgi:hypothetical protein
MADNSTLARDRLGNVIQALPIGTTQTVAYTGTAGVTTNAIGTSMFRIVCTTDAFVATGTAPTATTAGMFVPAKTPEWFPIDPGHKVSVIQASASGSAYIMGGG